MARLIEDGGEGGDLLPFETTSGTVANTATNARINGRCYSYNGTAYGQFALPSAVSEFYSRHSLYMDNSGTAFVDRWFSGATELGSIRFNTTSRAIDIYTSTGTLQVSGTRVLNINTFYVIELHVKIADSGGVIEYKIDGVLQSSSFSGDTKPGSDTTINKWRVGGIGSFNVYADDFVLNDTTGGADNSWCGDGHFYPLTPNNNGDSSQFTGSDGNSTDNYLLVDDVPSNSDTDYVAATSVGNKDLYTFTDLPSLPTGATVRAVIVETRARELTADGDSISLLVKHSSTESSVVNVVLGTSYASQKAEFLTNPSTSAAWTVSEVNAMQAGYSIP